MSALAVSEIVGKKRAIIFDLFHTLTSLETTRRDNRPLTHVMLGVSKEAWDEQLHERSRERLIGVQTDAYAIIREMARAIDPSISEDVVRLATENRIAMFGAALVHMPPRAQEAVRELRRAGKRIGLVSNADAMEMAAWTDCPIRDQFDSTIFSCQVGSIKPEPGIYHRSLEELAVSPSEALFVGDGSSRELEGARAVGITTIMITGIIKELCPERIPERRQHADFVIEELSELLSCSQGKQPNKAPEPTPGTVTPRAIERDSK